MKLSKNLLNAILIGVTIGTATSCEKITLDPDNPVSMQLDQAQEQEPEMETCIEGEIKGHGGEMPYDCPACGMG